jgi:threonine/homoserine/homoserine lactone efflux protein
VSSFPEFAVISPAVNVTPRPRMAFIANRALARDARIALAAQGGLAVGVLARAVVTAVGVAQLGRNPTALRCARDRRDVSALPPAL